MEIARQKAYRKTFDLACATLAGLSLEEQAAKAGLSLPKKAMPMSYPCPLSMRP